MNSGNSFYLRSTSISVFSALVLYKMAILDAQGIGFSPCGLPIIKALLLAKFILLGHAVRLGDRPEREG